MNKKNTVLVVDDEPQLRKLLKITLDDEGFKVEEAENAGQAIRLASSIKPDAMILDLGLPDMDGKEVIDQIRSWSQLPIIVCSVRNEDKEIVEALERGADDYVVKPFNPDILIARLNSNLRKSAANEAGEPSLQNGDLFIDLVKHEVKIKGQSIFFTPKEYNLLRYLMVNKGKMLTHKQLLNDVWGPAHSQDMQYLRVYISQLREKIEDKNSSIEYIKTEPAIGYRMEILETKE